MARQVITGPGKRDKLPDLLEGYLFGMGEVCYGLFGATGEAAMYLAVGKFFLQYLEKNMGIHIDASEPWPRYCQLIELFTKHGFYDTVELEERGNGSYWMLETNQYAGQIWDEQGSWTRGSAPCPLWTLVLASLSEIGQKIVPDEIRFDEASNGFESTFHFEPVDATQDDILAVTRKKLLSAMMTFCVGCKKVRMKGGEWVPADVYFHRQHDASISHGYCPECLSEAVASVRNTEQET